jgi:methionine aminotransferase
MSFESKLPNTGTTIFSVMSKLANETGAINLSQGFPNFPIDEKLKSVLSQKIHDDVHQYTPMSGLPELTSGLSQLINRTYGRSLNPEMNILVTAGATQGIFSTILALVRPGDEVIILDPSYDCYEPAVILAGGGAVRIPLNSDFCPDWNKIEHSVSEKTRLIITNNPHNPSGRVWVEEDFISLENIMEQRPELFCLSDEVYEFISFEKKHISMNSRHKIKERTVIASSFGKTFHITGWKIGYLVGPENLISEIKKVHQFNVFSVNSVSQHTLAEYLNHVDVGDLSSHYRIKRDLFRSLLKNSNFKLLPCEGTYFQLADYSSISNIGDVEFCKYLAIENGVAAIPVSVFNANLTDKKIIRFCFAKDDQTLINAAKLLCKT